MMKKNLMLIGLLLVFDFAEGQTFLNGDFETNTCVGDQINLSNSGYNGYMADSYAFGSYGDVDIITSSTWGSSGAQSGNWYIALTGSGTDAVSLTLSAPLMTGNSYSISFYDRADAGFTPFPFEIGLSTVNNSFGTNIYTVPVAPSVNVWTQRTFTFVAPNSGQYITMQMTGGGTGAWAHVDNFSFMGTGSTPNVSFSSSDTAFCGKQCINFFDQSTNTPTSWQWTFSGASPATSTLQNPTNICYNNYGTFLVKLIASNNFGSDSLVMNSFITVFQDPADPTVTLSGDTLISSPSFAYQWYNNSVAMNGETNQSYVALQSGNYYVVITDSNGCTAASGVIPYTLGLNEFPVSGLEFLVNQINASSFIVSADHVSGKNISLKIFNAIGEMVYAVSEKNFSGKYLKQIDLIKNATGIYFLQIGVDEKMISKKILVLK